MTTGLLKLLSFCGRTTAETPREEGKVAFGARSEGRIARGASGAGLA